MAFLRRLEQWLGQALEVSKLCHIPLAINVVANYDDLYDATGTPTMPKLIPSRKLERHILGSTVNMVPRVNVFHFKESFGAIGVFRHSYELQLV